jgi:hypothetical protein
LESQINGDAEDAATANADDAEKPFPHGFSASSASVISVLSVAFG